MYKDHQAPEQPICSVIIPAYNEEAVIVETLTALTKDMRAGEFDIIVVCNGCQDTTAAKAAATCPQATVIIQTEASKTKALNTGLENAAVAPYVFLDADIITTAQAVRALVHRLEWSEALMAVGHAKFITDQSNFLVRAFYKAWLQNPYFDRHKMGGFFAVNAAGIKALGTFPETINDDEYVRRSLYHSCTFAGAALYEIKAPRTLSSLIKVRARVYRGNRLLDQAGSAVKDDSKPVDIAFDKSVKKKNALTFLHRLIRQPVLWFGAGIFAFTAVMAHMRNFLNGQPAWEKDMTNRAGSVSITSTEGNGS